MERIVAEQMELSKMVGIILEKKIGMYFHNDLQGAGKAFSLKIVVTNGNERFLNEARTLLSKLGLSPEKINKHGVGGHKYTLIYELFSISPESQVKIRDLVKEMTGSSLKIKPQDIGGEVQEIPEISVDVPEASSIPSFKKRQRKTIEAKCKGELSNFLNARLSTMGINPEVYPFDNLNQTLVINCRNERIAKEIESLLLSTSVREGSSVMVDCENFWRNFQNATLSAPDSSCSKEFLLLKILKINRSFIVDFQENGVLLKLRRKDSLEYALETFKANEWDFSLEGEGGILLHYCLQVKNKEKEEVSLEVFSEEDQRIEVIGKLKRLLSLDLSPEVRRQITTAINDQEAKDLLKRLKALC